MRLSRRFAICELMDLDWMDLDLPTLVRRVVGALRPPAELRDDLIQEGLVRAIDLLQRFTPADPDLDPRVQAERYLAVSLRWQLRAYLRSLRTPLTIPERDRRLAQAYSRLVAVTGLLPVAEAAAQLGVTPERLAQALAATERVTSLDRPRPGDADRASSLVERIASSETTPEDRLVAAVDDRRAALGEALVAEVARNRPPAGQTGRREQVRHLLYLVLAQLPSGDAEIVRLAFALPREEVGTLRSCRAYGCRRDRGHEHPALEIARWVGYDLGVIEQRLADSLDELATLLGGRDPRRLLHQVSSAAAPALSRRAHRFRVSADLRDSD